MAHSLELISVVCKSNMAGMRNNSLGRSAYCIVSEHSTTELSGAVADRKEGNVLFNDALNTFYLRLYGVGHMVKDHSDSEGGNSLPPHGLLFPINSKGSFIWLTGVLEAVVRFRLSTGKVHIVR